MMFLKNTLNEFFKNKKGLSFIIMILIFILLWFIISNCHVDYYFNDLSDKANYILHYSSLIKTWFPNTQEIRLPIFLSYFFHHLFLGLWIKSINSKIIILLFLNIITLSIFYRSFLKKEWIQKTINKDLIMVCIMFFFNFAILNIFRGIYAEILFFPLIFLWLYFILKEKYWLTALLFLIWMFTKIEWLIIFPLFICYYLIFIFDYNLIKQKIILTIQILLRLLWLFTIFLSRKLWYLNIYYNLPPWLAFFVIVSVLSLIAFWTIYKFKKNIISMINIKIIRYILIFLLILFFLINPIRYFILGWVVNEEFILNNLATATDLDLINIYRVFIIIWPLPFIWLFWRLKKNFYWKLKILINKQLIFTYILFLAFFVILFNESYHEPNLLIRIRRFYFIIIPVLLIILINFLKTQQKYIQLFIISFIIIFWVSYNCTLEYTWYTKWINAINHTMSAYCNNTAYLYDNNVYTHEAIYTSLVYYKNNTVFKYSDIINWGINNKVPNWYCIIIPERFILTEGNIIKWKNNIAKIPIKFNRYDNSILKIPNKIEISYNIYIYK